MCKRMLTEVLLTLTICCYVPYLLAVADMASASGAHGSRANSAGGSADQLKADYFKLLAEKQVERVLSSWEGMQAAICHDSRYAAVTDEADRCACHVLPLLPCARPGILLFVI